MNDSFDILAIFKANTSNFERGVAGVRRSLTGVSKDLKGMDKVKHVLSSTGKALTVGLTLPLAAAGTAAFKHAANFEEAMIGVAKTTDLVGDDFKKLEKDITNMSMRMPQSATEIAGVAEAAGQLGIEKDNITGFTENMLKLGMSTNMSAEEAATSLARLANITGMSQKDFDRLGSVVVELGNNLATTESEIVNMSLRLAGAGHQVGLTEAEIMALSGAMSSVGINAEAGGSAMSRVLQKINTEVLSSGENLEGFAQVAGMTAQDFAQTWQDEPTVALEAFIKGLDDVKQSGGDVTQTLKDLGINSTQELNTLLSLAGASDVLSESLDMANGAWEENTALNKEADAAMQSTKAQIDIAKGKIAEAARVMAVNLLPIVSKVVEWVGNLAQKFTELSPKTQKVISIIVALLAALGPFLIILPAIISILSGLWTAITTIWSALTVAFGIIKAILGIILAVGKGILALMSPIGIIIAAIGAVIGVLIYLYNTNETVREFINNAWANIKEFVSNVISTLVEFVRTKWEELKENISIILEAIVTWITEKWTQITEFMSQVMGVIKEIISVAWGAIKTVVSTVIDVIQTIIETVWNFIKETTTTIWETIKSVIETVITTIQTIITTVFTTIQSIVTTIWNAISSFISSTWETIKSVVSNAINNVKSTVSNVLGQIREKFQEIFGRVVSIVRDKFNEVKSAVSRGMQQAYDKVTEFVDKFFQAGENIVNNIAKGIRNGVGAVTDAIGGVLSKARDLLPFSPPKDKSSPLVDIHKNGITEQIAKGILNGKREVDRAMNSVLDQDLAFASGRINSSVQHDVGAIDINSSPLQVNLTMGGRTYRGFSDDINYAQGQTLELKELM